MRYLTLLLLILMLGVSCNEDSFARYRIRGTSLVMLPDLSPAPSYRSSSDTIELSLLTEASYYGETDLPSPIPGNQVDKVEVENYDRYAAPENPSYLVRYHLESIPNGGQPSGSIDEIKVSLTSAGPNLLAELLLINDDSLRCGTPNCRYVDTLTLDSVTYLHVYYLAEDPSSPNIYINEREGIVAFRDANQKFYQRIK